jgi:hypothetical protein
LLVTFSEEPFRKRSKRSPSLVCGIVLVACFGAILVLLGPLTIIHVIFRLSTESLFIYRNQFTGQLPSTFGSLDLIRLQAHKNGFTGTIPESLFSSTNLLELRLDSNQFVGTISDRIGDLTALRDLRLNENQFTGTFLATIARLSDLSTLHVFVLTDPLLPPEFSLFESTNTTLLLFQDSWF